MKRLYVLTLCTAITAVCIFFLKKKTPTTIAGGDGLIVPRSWLYSTPNQQTPHVDIRPADQTFLTFPEWFLVFSPDEQAAYFKHHTATTFPFTAHTAQIWESYKIVSNQVKDIFPTNAGYHFMIWVIGSSASVEYTIKAWYEKIIGRLTDTYIPATEEDKFNANFTQSYVDFIKDHPWYEYNFKQQLALLWNNVPLTGSNMARKAERRYILTSELMVKYVYGKLIGMGTKKVYEVAMPTTAVVLENDSLCLLPRYDKFMFATLELALKGHSFKEIAGNHSAILVTVLAPLQKQFNLQNTVILFEQPVTSNPDMKRTAIVTPVTQLAPLLSQLNHDNIKTEHVFDY